VSGEEVLFKKVSVKSKGAVSKISLKANQIANYKKVVIKYVKNEVRFGVVRFFFANKSEFNKKGGEGSLMINKDKPELEIELDNPNNLTKMTLYFSNARDEEETAGFEVYGIK